jgi:hypothetical protein
MVRRHARFWTLATLAVGLAAGACSSSPTAPDSLVVALEEVQLRTEAEWQDWPHAPIIAGAEAVTVRGTALAGCGEITAEAVQFGRSVMVKISAGRTNRMCIAAYSAWRPFVVTLTGLRPGSYDVRVIVAGHDDWVRSKVAVTGG